MVSLWVFSHLQEGLDKGTLYPHSFLLLWLKHLARQFHINMCYRNGKELLFMEQTFLSHITFLRMILYCLDCQMTRKLAIFFMPLISTQLCLVKLLMLRNQRFTFSILRNWFRIKLNGSSIFSEYFLPSVYLVIPFFMGSNRSSYWSSVIQRIQSRITSWKVRWLSLAGKIFPIKSVLAAIPNYFSVVLKIPSKVLKTILKLIKGFLW